MEIIKDTFSDLKLCEQNDESTIQKTCYGCDEVIAPHSWYYSGKDDFGNKCMLHKFCAELPTEMAHPLHPHLLKLNRHHYIHRSCDFCNSSGGDRFMYHCIDCDFGIDLICAGDATLRLLSTKSPKERERMALKDHIHPHQLKLLHIQSRHHDDDDEVEDGDDIIRQCKACLQPIVDSSYYICTGESEGCRDYFLHRVCGELPLEMKHELHLLHPLMLMLSPPADHFKCFACGKFCQGHIYSCRACFFQLHIICATTASRLLEHKCHQHSLMLLPMSNSSLFCSACCKVHEGIFYQCNTCVVFYIHRDCASLGYDIYHPSHEGHPLRLGYHLDSTKMRNKCDICSQKIYYRTGWFYFCWECKFYSHLNCIINSDNDDETPDIDPEIPLLPWEEADNEFGSVGLLNMKLRSIQNDEDIEMDTINHFSHPKHPLILQRDVPREANPYSDGEIILTTQCNGCCKQISAPLYSCADCHFYIHKSCALLPPSVAQHHVHADYHSCRLLLVTKPWHETRVFACEFCHEICNGFCYQCEDESCNYQTDVECAFLPGKIVHKAHSSHSLALVPQPSFQENVFKCCSKFYTYGYRYVYKCDTCSFMIHTRCAMYPAKADHRFDCNSPFQLCYNPSQIEPNEYHYCEICEFQVNPKLWFYFSSKWGGQIMHLECILLRYKVAVKHSNFKSVSSLLEANIHPHPLHLFPTYDLEKCHHCEMRMDEHNVDNRTDVHHSLYAAYCCNEWDCEYSIHVKCAKKLIREAKGDTVASSKG